MSRYCCHVDGCKEPHCTMDPEYGGPLEDCSSAAMLHAEGRGKEFCEDWRPETEEVATGSKFQKAAALVREALEVAKNAYEEGQGSPSFPWSMASANLAAENIEKALEALEKEA